MSEPGVADSEAGEDNFFATRGTVGCRSRNRNFLMDRSLLGGKEYQKLCQEELMRER